VKPKLWQAIIVRAGLYILLVLLGLTLFPSPLHALFGYFGAAALTTFLAGLIANLFTLRIYEQLTLPDAGLRWNHDSTRNLLYGLGGGSGAALLVIAGLLITGSAQIVRAPNAKFDAGSVAFVTVLLMAGAAGEELMFRGYGFQYLLPRIGEWATILPCGILFGVAHMGNKNVTLLAVVNTVAWGILLGYAFLRSHDLWLPMGIHFGWNWTLPMLGANLSGFSMQVTGIELKTDPAAAFSGGSYGPEGSILTTLVVAAVAWYLHRTPVTTQASALLDRVEEG
jgi:membrane protease YdiL (CAAX protease family)